VDPSYFKKGLAQQFALQSLIMMHKLGFKRDVSIYYNRVMANVILKEGGEIINEIDITNDEV
jgi:hypothetical protein